MTCTVVVEYLNSTARWADHNAVKLIRAKWGPGWQVEDVKLIGNTGYPVNYYKVYAVPVAT